MKLIRINMELLKTMLYIFIIWNDDIEVIYFCLHSYWPVGHIQSFAKLKIILFQMTASPTTSM